VTVIYSHDVYSCSGLHRSRLSRNALWPRASGGPAGCRPCRSHANLPGRKEIESFDSERVERLGELADAVPAELVGGVDRELGVLLADDFAIFPEGAGDDVNSAPLAM
jgi:hypothetical protein